MYLLCLVMSRRRARSADKNLQSASICVGMSRTYRAGRGRRRVKHTTGRRSIIPRNKIAFWTCRPTLRSADECTPLHVKSCQALQSFWTICARAGSRGCYIWTIILRVGVRRIYASHLLCRELLSHSGGCWRERKGEASRHWIVDGVSCGGPPSEIKAAGRRGISVFISRDGLLRIRIRMLCGHY